MNVRRRDDGPARGQAPPRSHTARDVVAGGLLAVVAAGILGVGAALGPGALRVAALLVALGAAGTWWSAGDAPALLAHARPVTTADRADLHASLRAFSQRAGVREPRLDLSPAPEPFVFTTGRSRRSARIALSAGLLALLDHDEVEAVLAREVARIRVDGAFATTVVLMGSAAILLAARALGVRDMSRGTVAIPSCAVSRVLLSDERSLDAVSLRLLPDGTVLTRALVKLDAARTVSATRATSVVLRASAALERVERAPGPSREPR